MLNIGHSGDPQGRHRLVDGLRRPAAFVGKSAKIDRPDGHQPLVDVDGVAKGGAAISLEFSYIGTHGAPTLGGFNTVDSFILADRGCARFTHAPESLVCA